MALQGVRPTKRQPTDLTDVALAVAVHLHVRRKGPGRHEDLPADWTAMEAV